jgi:hypothetical protein
MYISKETEEQTEKRLLKVISKAEFKVYIGAYAFEGFPINEFRVALINPLEELKVENVRN